MPNVKDNGPLRTIVSEGYGGPTGHDYYLTLECGHRHREIYGTHYGKRTRCYQCLATVKRRSAIQRLAGLIPTADELLARGRLAEATQVWYAMDSFLDRLTEALEREDLTIPSDNQPAT